MVFGSGSFFVESLVDNELWKNPPSGGLGGGGGDLGVFPAGGLSSGGSWGGDGGVITASWAETRGVFSQAVTMALACSASGVWWEAKSPSGVGSGFSGGVNTNLSTHWQPAFSDTLPSRACPAASRKLDGLCLS
jgi:hypothetical protein